MRISDWSSDVCSSDLSGRVSAGSWHRPTQLRGRLRHHCRSHPVDIPRGPARRDAELPFNAGPDARPSHVPGVRRFPAPMAPTLTRRLRSYTEPSAEGGTARCRSGVLRADPTYIEGDGATHGNRRGTRLSAELFYLGRA